ncbi:MAG: hypothetical protein QW734_07500 [Candidatus Bathyarchaeia archaeon]
MAEAVAGGTAIAIATAQATSIASAIANAVATAAAGISIGLGYAGGQAIREASGSIRDLSKSVIGTVLRVLREYFRLITEKPEIGLTGTILAIYLMV